MDIGAELEFRESAMRWLAERVAARSSDRFAYAELADYRDSGVRVPLIDRQRGIRKPAGFNAALSIRTVYRAPGQPRPYEDLETAVGTLIYKYRGDDPKHHENEAIRLAKDLQLPLIWFVGVAPGVYVARHPVWVLEDDPGRLQFLLELPRHRVSAAGRDPAAP